MRNVTLTKMVLHTRIAPPGVVCFYLARCAPVTSPRPQPPELEPSRVHHSSHHSDPGKNADSGQLSADSCRLAWGCFCCTPVANKGPLLAATEVEGLMFVRKPKSIKEPGGDEDDLIEYTKPNGRRARRVPPAPGEALEVKSSMVQGCTGRNCSACEAISPRASLSS
jgi:hypothetical protein